MLISYKHQTITNKKIQIKRKLENLFSHKTMNFHKFKHVWTMYIRIHIIYIANFNHVKILTSKFYQIRLTKILVQRKLNFKWLICLKTSKMKVCYW